MEDKIKKGDYVTTTFSHPYMQQTKFTVEIIETIRGEEHAGSEKHGCFPTRLLKKIKR